MEFFPYPSSENHYQNKFINQILYEGKAGGVWHASEKVHGANASFYYDGKEAKFGKRSSFIDVGGNFFGFQAVVPRLEQAAKEYWDSLSEKPDYIILFGELCGGSYSHPEVEKVAATKVQREIDYSPRVEFILFDIVEVRGDEKKFVNADVIDAFGDGTNGVFAAPHVFTGTFDECLKIQNEFPTKVPALFGLPDIEGNTCEGIVIKPVQAAFLNDGSRVIIKSKNARFSEMKKVPNPKTDPAEPMSPENLELVRRISEYINQPRVANVCSKIGEVSIKDFGTVLKALMNDVFMEAKQSIELKGMDGKVGKMVNRLCAEEVKLYFTGSR